MMISRVIFIFFITLQGCEKQSNTQDPVLNKMSPSLSHSDLVGNWTGKWDNIYYAEFFISTQNDENEYHVEYRWEELADNPLNERQYNGKIVNQNTIQADKIFIRIDPYDSKRALAFGKFKIRTRIAYLKKSN